MFKALLKSRLLAYAAWLAGGGRRQNKRSTGRTVLFVVLMLYAYGCMAFLFGMYFDALAAPFAAAGIGWFYFALMGLAAFAVMFIFSAFMAKAQLFEAKDNDLLLSLPIPPRLILAARMLSLLTYNLLFGLIVMLPALVVWLRCAQVNALGLLAFAAMLVCLPLLSLACSSLLGWLLALVTARVRRKSLMTTAFSLAFLAVYMYGYNKLFTVVQQLAVTGAQVAESWRAAAPLYWLGSAIADGDAGNLLRAVLVCLAGFGAVYAVLSVCFVRITTKKHAAARVRYREKALKVSSARQALRRREWKRLLSSPTYLLNCGIILVFLIVGAAALILFRRDVTAFTAMLGLSGDAAAVAAGACAAFMCGMMAFTTPAVSLEGRSLWIVRSAPVTGQEVLYAKLYLHLSATYPPMVLFLAACLWVFRPTFWGAAVMCAVPLLYVWLMGNIGLIENLRRPDFDWVDESKPVKQDLPVLITMLLGWLLVGGAAALYLLAASAWVGLLPYAAVCAVLELLAALLTARWLRTRGAARFDAL